MFPNIQAALALGATAVLLAGMTGPAIGVVMANGSFRLDNALISGNGTLFDGSVIETAQTASELLLPQGAKLLLAAQSRGKVYRDRFVLEKGEGLLEAEAYRIEARALRVQSGDRRATAHVALNGNVAVTVTALGGPVRVSDGQGLLLANIASGRALAFEPQAGAASATTVKGIEKTQDGRFFLKDETTGVTFELRGTDLNKYAGKRVQISGSEIPNAQPAPGASRVLQVATGSLVLGTAPAGAAAGMATGTKVIIAGVIIGGAAAGTAVGLTRGDEETQPPVSR